MSSVCYQNTGKHSVTQHMFVCVHDVCVHDVCVRDVRAAAASYQSDQQAFAFISMTVTKADMT